MGSLIICWITITNDAHARRSRSRSTKNWRSALALTLGENETLGAHFLEALERRTFTERQVRSVYKLKGFFETQNLFILFEL